MKKFICFITAAIFAVLSINIVVAEDNTVTGHINGDTLFIDYAGSDAAVLVIYDKNGAAVYGNNAKNTGGGYEFRISEDFSDYAMKVYLNGGKICNVIISDDTEPTALPTEEPAKEPTQQPTEAATAAPARTPYPEVYSSNPSALHAPAVVRKVSTQSVDGETVYEVTMLYQGIEITADIRDTILISSVPNAYSDLKGQTASYLKEGDVIHFTSNLSHKINRLELIYRPDFRDYLSDGTALKSLVGFDSYNKYVFGVPVKTGKGYVLLADLDGKTTEVDLESGTFIYSVKNSRHGDKTDFLGTGYANISATYVPKNNFDDSDNVVSWSDTEITSYALARVVDKTATEVIVFEY